MRNVPTLTAALAAVTMLTAARPGNEFNLVTQLNGQDVRWTMSDGGQSGMGGTSCMSLSTLPGAANGVVDVVPAAPINLCVVNASAVGDAAWDGGCNTYVGDPNFGLPLQGYVSKVVVLKTTATHLCQATDAGAAAATAVFSKQ